MFAIQVLPRGRKHELTIYAREETTAVKAPPTIRFADDPRRKPTKIPKLDEDVAAIQNLCEAIRPSVIQPGDNLDTSKLGYLESKARSKLVLNLDPMDQIFLQGYKIESLEAFVKATPRRDTRLKVGCDLILAILSLGNSSWIPDSWTAKDLFVVRDPALPSSVPQPFFNHPWLRDSLSNKKEPRSTAVQTRASLFSLGVLLLELVFRDQLENQPFRAALLGPDKRPNQATELATALVWQQKVEEELGHDLADAIKRCLVCMFEQSTTPDLSNSSFVQAVWQQVVRPIESFVLAWNRS